MSVVFMSNQSKKSTMTDMNQSEISLFELIDSETMIVAAVASRMINELTSEVLNYLKNLSKKFHNVFHKGIQSIAMTQDQTRALPIIDVPTLDCGEWPKQTYSVWQGTLNFLYQRKGLILSLLVAALIMVLPKPGPAEFAGQVVELSDGGYKMLALLAMIVIIFITESLPLGATVALVYGWVVIFDIYEVDEAAAMFSHDAVWFLIGALMMAQALVKYNLHKRVLVVMIRFVGTKTRNVAIGIFIFCAITAVFVSEHTIAALMLPVGIAMVETMGGFKKVPNIAKLLMLCIAFGCALGGLGSPSGGGRNIIMIGLLENMYNINIGYGAWVIMALPVIILITPFLIAILLKTFPPETTDLGKATTEMRKEMRMSKMGVKEWGTAVIFLLILFLWITKSDLGMGMLAMIGTLLYLAFGLIRWRDCQKINWGIALLYFGAIGLGTGLNETGAALWMASSALSWMHQMVPIEGTFIYTVMSAIIMGLASQVVSNGPCVATLGPVMLEGARLVGSDPVFMGIASACASTFAYILVIGSPPNAIVYSSGFLKAKDFLKAGIPAFIISMFILLSFIKFWCRTHRYCFGNAIDA